MTEANHEPPVDLGQLFDAVEYYRHGSKPWTFFAYPTSLANPDGLPPDDDAVRFLGDIQKSGIEVALWKSPFGDNTTWFACKSKDIEKLKALTADMQTESAYGEDFLFKRSEQLFARTISGD